MQSFNGWAELSLWVHSFEKRGGPCKELHLAILLSKSFTKSQIVFSSLARLVISRKQHLNYVYAEDSEA